MILLILFIIGVLLLFVGALLSPHVPEIGLPLVGTGLFLIFITFVWVFTAQRRRDYFNPFKRLSMVVFN